MADCGVFRRSRTESRIVGTAATVLCGLGWVSALWPGAAAVAALVLAVLGATVWKLRSLARASRARRARPAGLARCPRDAGARRAAPIPAAWPGPGRRRARAHAGTAAGHDDRSAA